MRKYIAVYLFMRVSGANLGKRLVTDTTGKWALTGMTAWMFNQRVTLNEAETTHTANIRPLIVGNMHQWMCLQTTRKAILFFAFVTLIPLLWRVMGVPHVTLQRLEYRKFFTTHKTHEWTICRIGYCIRVLHFLTSINMHLLMFCTCLNSFKHLTTVVACICTLFNMGTHVTNQSETIGQSSSTNFAHYYITVHQWMLLKLWLKAKLSITFMTSEPLLWWIMSVFDMPSQQPLILICLAAVTADGVTVLHRWWICLVPSVWQATNNNCCQLFS